VPILFYYPRIKNDFVRLSLWLVPPVYGILFVIGVVYELRIYVECIPIVLAANVVLIHQASQHAKRELKGLRVLPDDTVN